MRRWSLAIVIVMFVAGCSTRAIVVKPDDVTKLNDREWTIKSPPTR
jgi:hypothetical protein